MRTSNQRCQVHVPMRTHHEEGLKFPVLVWNSRVGPRVSATILDQVSKSRELLQNTNKDNGTSLLLAWKPRTALFGKPPEIPGKRLPQYRPLKALPKLHIVTQTKVRS
ncbi:hypothetical protein TNCV_1871911 [Trichonephila clavipes]|nr:hypothetical protein TNCV_1871911 [Trichonephila clavipes]